MVVNKIVKFLQKPLPAVALTNELLIISGATGIMLTALLVAFSGNIETSSVILTSVVEDQNNRVQEKLTLISADYNNNGTDNKSGTVKIVLSNYGNVISKIIEIYDITSDKSYTKPHEFRCTDQCGNKTGQSLFDCIRDGRNNEPYEIKPDQQITLSCIGKADNNTDMFEYNTKYGRINKTTEISTGTNLLFITEYKNIINAKVQGPQEFKVTPKNVTSERVFPAKDNSRTVSSSIPIISTGNAHEDDDLHVTVLYHPSGYYETRYVYKITLDNDNINPTTIDRFTDGNGLRHDDFNNNCIKGRTGNPGLSANDKILASGSTTELYCTNSINVPVGENVGWITTKGNSKVAIVVSDTTLREIKIQNVQIAGSSTRGGDKIIKITVSNGLLQPIAITGMKNIGDTGDNPDELFNCDMIDSDGIEHTSGRNTHWAMQPNTQLVITCDGFSHTATTGPNIGVLKKFYSSGDTFELYTNATSPFNVINGAVP